MNAQDPGSRSGSGRLGSPSSRKGSHASAGGRPHDEDHENAAAARRFIADSPTELIVVTGRSTAPIWRAHGTCAARPPSAVVRAPVRVSYAGAERYGHSAARVSRPAAIEEEDDSSSSLAKYSRDVRPSAASLRCGTHTSDRPGRDATKRQIAGRPTRRARRATLPAENAGECDK